MCILHDALVKIKKQKEIEEREQNEVVNAQSRTITLINLKFFDSAKSNANTCFLIAVQNSIQPSKEEEMRKIQKNQRLNNRWVQKMLVLIQCFF